MCRPCPTQKHARSDTHRKIGGVIRTCEYEDCSEAHLARGMCGYHYRQWRRKGGGAKPCTIEGCKNPSESVGMCPAHRERVRRRKPTDTQIRQWRKPEELLERNEFGHKKCIHCSEWLPESSFSKGTSRDGLQGRCKSCVKWVHVEKTYNITKRGYEQLLATQGGGCMICGKTEEGGARFHIDHDHSCCPKGGSCGDCVRGILCSDCNTGIGLFYDNPDLLRCAAAYVETHTKTGVI